MWFARAPHTSRRRPACLHCLEWHNEGALEQEVPSWTPWHPRPSLSHRCPWVGVGGGITKSQPLRIHGQLRPQCRRLSPPTPQLSPGPAPASSRTPAPLQTDPALLTPTTPASSPDSGLPSVPAGGAEPPPPHPHSSPTWLAFPQPPPNLSNVAALPWQLWPNTTHVTSCGKPSQMPRPAGPCPAHLLVPSEPLCPLHVTALIRLPRMAVRRRHKTEPFQGRDGVPLIHLFSRGGGAVLSWGQRNAYWFIHSFTHSENLSKPFF